MSKPRGIFISYRRDGGDNLAGRVRDALAARGYKAFLDVEDLKTGKFNDALFAEIDRCADFVVILSPGSLDRCTNDGDWVRLEIAHALKQKKNIVPILGRNFQFPQQLPADIDDLRHYNGLGASHDLFDASMDRLVRLLATPRASRRSTFLAIGVSVALLLTIGGILLYQRDIKSDADAEAPSPWTPSPSVALKSADFDDASFRLAQSCLRTLGQKKLLYQADSRVRILIGRVVNHTQFMIDTDLFSQRLRSGLLESGGVEAVPGRGTLQDLQVAFPGKEQKNLYAMEAKIIQLSSAEQHEYVFSAYLVEIASGLTVWEDSVTVRKARAPRSSQE